MIKKILGLSISIITNIALACTSFGAITTQGSIIGKNRDYLYSPQVFTMMQPLKQFQDWYDNSYHHSNHFYALIASSDVKFGVNESGLTAIEEDPPFPSNAHKNRKFIQPYRGYAEGMILYGVLQNFNTIQEMIPYIKQIFSTAAPNYYQFADANQILTVEVAYGARNNSTTRRYSYQILNKPGEYFTHTNTYLSPQFTALNKLSTNTDGIRGSNNRLEKITEYLKQAHGDFDSAFNWYLDTKSTIASNQDKNFCENTSIFRSNLQDLKNITADTDSKKVYGTVSSFMVEHKKYSTLVHIRIINSIDTLSNGDQQITYKELTIPLDKLFASNQPQYITHSFVRKAPVNGVCN